MSLQGREGDDDDDDDNNSDNNNKINVMVVFDIHSV